MKRILLLIFMHFPGLALLWGQNDCDLPIETPPPDYNFFYLKFVTANGVPILSSGRVPDNAFCIAYDIVYRMTENLPEEVVSNMIRNGAQLSIMSETEVTTDIPEHSDLYTQFPGTDWDVFRGIGGTLSLPVTSCAEEDLLCYNTDIYFGESIAVHEFAHGIHNLGLAPTYPNFERDLENLYNDAIQNGLWSNTYAGSNYIEYFAEGVQSWFNTNLQSSPADGIHNQVNTRQELQQYDPDLYDFIERYFETDWQPTCDPGEVVVESTTSTREIGPNSLTVSPNPTNGKIEISGVGIQALKVIDILGNIIVQNGKTDTEINISGLPSGIYFLLINSGNQWITRRIMKE